MSQSVVNPTATSVVPSTSLVLMGGNPLTSETAVVSRGPNRLDCFAKGGDNALWHTWFDPNGWHSWESLGGVLTSAPAVASWGPNRLDCFAKGTDNALWHKWSDGNTWHDWESLGGNLIETPAVVSWGPNRLDCFIRGMNNVPWHKWLDDNGWHDWQSLGGAITSAPAVTSWAAGRLDCLATGTDNALWHKWFDGHGWHDWQSLSGNLVEAPAVASWGPNRLDCFIRGTDNALWHKWFDGTNWHDWQSLDGVLTSAPAVVSWAPNRLDCFIRGTDNALWHKWFDGTRWPDWERLGGNLIETPAVASWGPNRLDCFACGTNSMLQHTWFDINGWHDWENLSNTLTAGIPVQLGTAHSPLSKDQLWTLTSDGHLQNQANPTLVLNLKDGQLTAGTPIELGTVSSPATNSQRWTLTSNGHLQNQANPTLVLDTAGGRLTAGTPILLGAVSSLPVTNQLWTLTSEGYIQSQAVPGVITIHHQGGYVARCTVEYDVNRQYQSQSSGNITSGQTYSVPLPLGTTNVHVKCEEATGLAWEPWRTVIDQTYPNAPQKSFTITGTTLSPNFTVEDGSGLTKQQTFTFINDLNRPAYVAVHHLGAAGLPWRDAKPKCWDQTLQIDQSATYAPDEWVVHFTTWMTLIADGLMCAVAIAIAIATMGAGSEVAAAAIAETAADAVAATSAEATSTALTAVEAGQMTAEEASTVVGEIAGDAARQATTDAMSEFAASGTRQALTRVASKLGMDADQFCKAVGPYVQMAQKYGSTVASVATAASQAVFAGVAVNSYNALSQDGWALYVEVDGHGYYVSNFIVSGGNYYIPLSLAISGLEIVVQNNGGYVARCTIEYDLSGQHQSQSSDNFPLAQSYSLLVPAGAINIHVHCEEATGLVWEPWRTVVDETNPGPAKLGTHKTYTLSGTTLNPGFSEQ